MASGVFSERGIIGWGLMKNRILGEGSKRRGVIKRGKIDY